ncbi:PilZ domain-containing protein [Candidatus Omnitrophota bacterium]
MSDKPKKQEKRQYYRVEHERPLTFRVVKHPPETDSTEVPATAVSQNLSAAGIYFKANIQKGPRVGSVILIDVDFKTAEICKELEQHVLIKDNKILGKVVRVDDNKNGTCGVGVAFVTKSDYRV